VVAAEREEVMMVVVTVAGSQVERDVDRPSVVRERLEAFGVGVLAEAMNRPVQVRNGEVLTSDGPFAETKEQIGGFYVVDAKDLDEAIEIAAKIPGARVGTIEVRPIWEM